MQSIKSALLVTHHQTTRNQLGFQCQNNFRYFHNTLFSYDLFNASNLDSCRSSGMPLKEVYEVKSRTTLSVINSLAATLFYVFLLLLLPVIWSRFVPLRGKVIKLSFSIDNLPIIRGVVISTSSISTACEHL